MKKMIISFLFAVFSTLLLTAQTQQNDCLTIFEIPTDQPALTLNPGDEFSADIIFGENPMPARRYLRVVGGIKMPGKFAPRGESRYRGWEYHIDDLLDSVNTYADRYSLYFEGHGEQFERRAYNRIGGESLTPGTLTVSANVRKNNMVYSGEGYFGIEIEVFLKKEGRHPHEVYYEPDMNFKMPFAEGSSGFETVSQDFDLPGDVGAILIKTGGTGFSGQAWVDGISVSQTGRDVIRLPFTFFDQRPDWYNHWVGVNMMSRGWPMWRLDIDGREAFRGNVFDRASNIADFYIELPEGLEGGHNLTLTLEREPFKAAFPYELRRVQLLTESRRDFEIVSVPSYPAVGDTTAILLEVNKPGIVLNIEAGNEVKIIAGTVRADETGLVAVPFTAVSPGSGMPVTVSANGETRTAVIKQSVVRPRDGVYISSGDEVHLDNVAGGIYDHFFKWYVRERVGNWYQFRPSHQWSGVRSAPSGFMKRYITLLNELRMPYAWQVEGRTMSAEHINPSLDALAGPMFRGKQAHENDGGYYYWRHFPYTGLVSDMSARVRPYGGIFAKHPPIYTDHGIFIHYDPYAVTDMADGARRYVGNLAYSRGESTRHTGPSTTFRYLYQAGYEWLGAEQMYGPEETVMSALRGASLAYGKKDFGSLHAVQWGSFPFTDPKHAERFFLSLAVAYIHGSSHINTEEGLWTDEYANDRYTGAGREHMRAQHSMLDYIETHSRRGEMRPGIAVLQGRNDPWESFGRSPVWSQEGEKWEFNRAKESFDLLKVFYPENYIGASGPDGWFSSTPYGPVDILPIEAEGDVLSRYKTLVFLGWNSYDDGDFRRLEKFVRNGGTLIMSAAHFNAELQPDVEPKLPQDLSALRRMLGRDFTKLSGRNDIQFGKGRIIYFADPKYPAEPELREAYETVLRETASGIAETEKARGWLQAAPHIEFTAWDSRDRRTVYVLNNDWDGDAASRRAVLQFNGHEFGFDVPRWMITTIHCFDNAAVIPLSNTADVLDYSPGEGFRVQCTEATVFVICRSDGSTDRFTCTEPGIYNIR